MSEIIEIPYGELEPETLNSLIESFVLREGTDYAHSNWTLEEKIEQVRKQIVSGFAKITFDQESETISILRKN